MYVCTKSDCFDRLKCLVAKITSISPSHSIVALSNTIYSGCDDIIIHKDVAMVVSTTIPISENIRPDVLCLHNVSQTIKSTYPNYI